MKMWTSSEMRSRPNRRSWIKFAARRLRDWLNTFLHESSEERVGASADGLDELEASSEGVEIDPMKLFEPAGPPEEWLKLVREGAPQLLEGEEREKVWQSLPANEVGPQTSDENDTTAREDASPATHSISKTPPSTAPKHRIVSAPSKPAWSRRLMEKLMPYSFGEIRSRARNTRLTSPETLARSSDVRPQRDGARDLTADSKPSQLRGTNAAQVDPDEHELPSISRSTETLSSNRTPERVFDITSANSKPPRPKLQDMPNQSALGNSERASFLAASPLSKVNLPASVIIDTKRAVPRPVPRSRIEEIPSTHHRNDLPRALSATRSDDESRRASAAVLADGSRPTAENLKEATTSRRDSANDPGSPPPRPIPDRWPIVTVRDRSLPTDKVLAEAIPEMYMYRDDRWPELPDTPATLPHEFAPELYLEHTRALDLEQRGGS
jgi:hypothetical protein